MTVLAHAAKAGFWRLPRFVLEKLARELNVSPKGTEVVLFESILKKLFPDETVEAVAEMLGQRGLVQHSEELQAADMPEDILDVLVADSDKKDVEDVLLILFFLL